MIRLTWIWWFICSSQTSELLRNKPSLHNNHVKISTQICIFRLHAGSARNILVERLCPLRSPRKHFLSSEDQMGGQRMSSVFPLLIPRCNKYEQSVSSFNKRIIWNDNRNNCQKWDLQLSDVASVGSPESGGVGWIWFVSFNGAKWAIGTGEPRRGTMVPRRYSEYIPYMLKFTDSITDSITVGFTVGITNGIAGHHHIYYIDHLDV